MKEFRAQLRKKEGGETSGDELQQGGHEADRDDEEGEGREVDEDEGSTLRTEELEVEEYEPEFEEGEDFASSPAEVLETFSYENLLLLLGFDEEGALEEHWEREPVLVPSSDVIKQLPPGVIQHFRKYGGISPSCRLDTNWRKRDMDEAVELMKRGELAQSESLLWRVVNVFFMGDPRERRYGAQPSLFTVQALSMLGNVYRQSGNLPKAHEVLDQAFDHLAALYGFLKHVTGVPDRRTTLLESNIALRKRIAYTHSQMGITLSRLYIDEGDLESALGALERAGRSVAALGCLGPSRYYVSLAKVRMRRAEELAQEGRKSEAAAMFEDVMLALTFRDSGGGYTIKPLLIGDREVIPTLADYLNRYSKVLVADGNLYEAFKIIQEALGLFAGRELDSVFACNMLAALLKRQASILTDLGFTDEALHRLELGLDVYRISKSDFRLKEDPPLRGDPISHTTYASLRCEKADLLFDRIGRIAGGKSDKRLSGRALKLWKQAMQETGLGIAVVSPDSGQSVFPEFSDDLIVKTCLANLLLTRAILLRRDNQYNEAVSVIIGAIVLMRYGPGFEEDPVIVRVCGILRFTLAHIYYRLAASLQLDKKFEEALQSNSAGIEVLSSNGQGEILRPEFEGTIHALDLFFQLLGQRRDIFYNMGNCKAVESVARRIKRSRERLSSSPIEQATHTSSPETKQKTKRTRTWATNQFPMQAWEENYDKVLAQTLHIPGGIVETIGMIGEVDRRRQALERGDVSIIGMDGTVLSAVEGYDGCSKGQREKSARSLDRKLQLLFEENTVLIVEGPKVEAGDGNLNFIGYRVGVFRRYGQDHLRLFFSQRQGIRKPIVRAVSRCVFGSKGLDEEIMVEQFSPQGELCRTFREKADKDSVVQLYRGGYTGFVAGVMKDNDGGFHHKGLYVRQQIYTPFKDSVNLLWLEGGSPIRAVALDGNTTSKSIAESSFDGFIRIEYKTRTDLRSSESSWRMFATISRKEEGVVSLPAATTLRTLRRIRAARVRVRHLPVRANTKWRQVNFCGPHQVSIKLPLGALLVSEFGFESGKLVLLPSSRVADIPEVHAAQTGAAENAPAGGTCDTRITIFNSSGRLVLTAARKVPSLDRLGEDCGTGLRIANKSVAQSGVLSFEMNGGQANGRRVKVLIDLEGHASERVTVWTRSQEDNLPRIVVNQKGDGTFKGSETLFVLTEPPSETNGRATIRLRVAKRMSVIKYLEEVPSSGNGEVDDPHSPYNYLLKQEKPFRALRERRERKKRKEEEKERYRVAALSFLEANPLAADEEAAGHLGISVRQFNSLGIGKE
ncbi:tetratricopeptide repeat protein, partial [Thermoproteota archaeon]